VSLGLLVEVQLQSGAHPERGTAELHPSKTPETEIKKKIHRFCRNDYIERFACFTLQPKSATEID
jgi:hypothetical protein